MHEGWSWYLANFGTRFIRASYLLGEGVGGFGDALELRFALEVQENGGFFDEAALEDALDDFVAVQWLAGLLEDFGDNVGDSALFVAPLFEGVNAAADQHEALVFDKFVMDGLGGDVFALEVAVFDGVGDFVEVHVLAVFFEDDVDLVTDVLGVNHRPFDQAPAAVEGSQVLRGASEGGGLLWDR